MAIQVPPEEVLTELAKHYGEDTSPQLKGTRKSGATPVDPLPPAGPALSIESWEIRKLIEALQRRKFLGFTARELKAMGAFAYFESPKASNFSSLLHPVFRNWESSQTSMRRHNPILPLGKGRDGYWELFNPLVEAALRPCLRLASQFIDNCHMWTWWDTLCFGELKPIHPEKKSVAGEILYSVHPRDPVIAHEESERVRERFIKLASHLTWGLTEGVVDPLTGRPIDLETGWQGITLSDPLTGSIRCCLDIGRIELLLRTDLKTAERLIIQFSIAKTAVHELAHAMWRLSKRMGPGLPPEPYFNNEVTIELGNSLTNHLLNGREVGITSLGMGHKERLYIAECMLPYPNWRDYTKRYPCLAKLESMRHSDYFPIPIEYFERIQQQDFWMHHVQVFGTPSVHMGPLVHGRRIHTSTLLQAPPVNDQQLILTEDAGERDVAAVNIENKKRLKAGIVWKALQTTITAEHSHDEEKLNYIRQNGSSSSMIQALAAGFNLNPTGWADKLAEESEEVQELEDHNEPARFSEIATFLLNHRQVLALDTMTYLISEYAFFEYINRLKKINITRAELRSFLIYANFKKVLFNWEKAGLGMVSRRNEGWGQATFKQPPRFKDPQAEHINLMKAHMSKFWTVYTLRGLRDLDEDLALYFFNRTMSCKLTKAEYGNIIDWCDHNNMLWARGPPGIVRCIASVPKRIEEARKRREEEAKKAEEEVAKRQEEMKKQKAKKQRLEDKKKKQAQKAHEWQNTIEKVVEQDDPDEPDLKRRKINDVLKGIENREKLALNNKDEDQDLGDPMDWEPPSG